MPALKPDLHVFHPGACCAVSRALLQGARSGLGLQVPRRSGVGIVLIGWVCLFLMPRWSHLDPCVPLQEYTATEQEMQQQMSLGELCHPVPQSFEPIKSFFKGLKEAMQSMLQKPLDVRLKESKSPCNQLRDPYSSSVL